MKEKNKPTSARMKTKMRACCISRPVLTMGTILIAKALACLCSMPSLLTLMLVISGSLTLELLEAMLSEVHALCNPINVTLGDGRNLRAVGHGNVIPTTKEHNKTKRCIYPPRCSFCTRSSIYSYNLLGVIGVTAASKWGRKQPSLGQDVKSETQSPSL